MHISKTPEETQEIGGNLAQKIKNGGIIYLYGDLGSGKTIFTKGIAQKLEIDHFSIKSPTYTYIRQYNNLYHIDLYRLDEIDDLLWHEIEEITQNSKNTVIIEWAEKLINREVPKGIEVHIKYLEGNKRQIDIKE